MNAKQTSVNIELLYLDLDICARCRETENLRRFFAVPRPSGSCCG